MATSDKRKARIELHGHVDYNLWLKIYESLRQLFPEPGNMSARDEDLNPAFAAL